MNHNHLPAAARRNFLARFVFDNEIIGTRPHMVRLRPIRQAGTNYDDQRILAQFATVLVREIRRLLRIHLPTWTNAQFNQRVRGRLIMSNWNNEGNANVEDANLLDITPATFARMFNEANANGSNPDLSIYDVQWSYFLVPNSLALGGSFGFTNPKNLKGIQHWNKKLKSIDNITHQDIGCATLAIALGMDLIDKNPLFVSNRMKNRFSSKQFTEHCMELQTELELGKICTPDSLSIFPFIYAEWRLAIISSGFTRPTVFTGIDYKRNSVHKFDKTVFIYHDLKSAHFVPVSGFNALMESITTSNHRVCYDCCSSYVATSGSAQCLCGEKQGTTRPHKYIVCSCNTRYQKGQKHRCGETRCKFCSQFYKKSNTKLHRCPIYIDPKSIEKVFKGI